ARDFDGRNLRRGGPLPCAARGLQRRLSAQESLPSASPSSGGGHLRSSLVVTDANLSPWEERAAVNVAAAFVPLLNALRAFVLVVRDEIIPKLRPYLAAQTARPWSPDEPSRQVDLGFVDMNLGEVVLSSELPPDE